MRRRNHAATILVALLIVVGGLAMPAHTQPEEEPKPPAQPKGLNFEDLEAKTQRTLAEAMRAYLDPATEFLWRPRKNLIAEFAAIREEHGVDPLKDLGFLRQLVYHGRHFLPRFSDRKWQKAESITEFKRTMGIYLNLKSEQTQFTYTVPKAYPKKEAGLDKVPRPAPMPLVLVIHESRDTSDDRGKAAKYPGEMVLKRLYDKGDFKAVYENWFTLAPVAPRGKFLEDDGRVRHRFLTQVLTDFWRRYHVDYDRIIVDGKEPALALAATFPQVFAGLVLRGGTVNPELVENIKGVPVFVVSSAKAKKTLEEAGHPDVKSGNERDALVWMNQRKRTVPDAFGWQMVFEDHKYPNWIIINTPDYTAPARKLAVKVLDTEDDPNTIQIKAEGMEEVTLYLNDDHVDLDREVRLVINGHESKHSGLERSLDQIFVREPNVRENMNFGWLYPVVLESLKVPEPKEGEGEEEPGEEPTVPAEGSTGSPEDENTAEKWWNKALAAEGEGSIGKAKAYYRKVIAVGETSFKARAEAKLQELADD